ncbi:MAG: isoamylase early set domain-containing protein [Actinomycetes bacterium]
MIRVSKVAKSNDVKVTFSLPQEQPSGTVSVVGDFNDWTPGKHVLAKRANGTRSVAVTVPAGTSFRFRYLGENGHWFDDEAAPRDGDAGRVDA